MPRKHRWCTATADQLQGWVGRLWGLGLGCAHHQERQGQSNPAAPRLGHDGGVIFPIVWRVSESTPTDLIQQLATESFAFDATGVDPERNCWLVVHRHTHGVLPSEYDIREVNEDLYLAVLAARKQLGQGI